MALVPFSYNTRSLFVRRSATLLTVLGIGATVATVAGVLALQQGFQSLFSQGGSDEVAIFLRPGSTSEGDSGFTVSRKDILVKTLPDIAVGADGRPVASGEIFLAVRRRKLDGGETNVPIRGVEPMTFDVHGDRVRMLEGRVPKPGTDEVIIGARLVDRIQDCRMGDVIEFNVTPFSVVGIFDHDGPYTSEIWGDRDRMAAALERPVYNRVIARLKAGTDMQELAERLENDPQVPAKVQTERVYLESQTELLTGMLVALGLILGVVMGAAAVFTATSTMLAALAARTQEIGILLAIGYRPFAIFASFLFESVLLGLLGGVIGCLLALPLNGIETGTSNMQTFTEVAFAFRVTPPVLVTAVLFSLMLGVIGGTWPALRASLLRPTEALRRG